MADIVVLCLDMMAADASKTAAWCTELQACCPDAHVILVATKADLLDETEDVRRRKAEIVHGYMEVSSLCDEGVRELFDCVVCELENKSKKSAKLTCSFL